MRKVVLALTVLAFVVGVLTAAYAQTTTTTQKKQPGYTTQHKAGTAGYTAGKTGKMGATKPGKTATVGKKTTTCPPGTAMVKHKRVMHKKHRAAYTPTKRAGAGPMMTHKRTIYHKGHMYTCTCARHRAGAGPTMHKRYVTHKRYRSYCVPTKRSGAGPYYGRKMRTSSYSSYRYGRRAGAGPMMTHKRTLYHKGHMYTCTCARHRAGAGPTMHRRYTKTHRYYTGTRAHRYTRAKRAGAGAGPGAPCPTTGMPKSGSY